MPKTEAEIPDISNGLTRPKSAVAPTSFLFEDDDDDSTDGESGVGASDAETDSYHDEADVK